MKKRLGRKTQPPRTRSEGRVRKGSTSVVSPRQRAQRAIRPLVVEEVPQLPMPAYLSDRLDEILDNINLVVTSDLFIKRLEKLPGGTLEFIQKQNDAFHVVINEYKLYCASLRHTTNNPLIHDLAVAKMEILSRISLRTAMERQAIARMISIVPQQQQLPTGGEGPHLLSVDEWMSEFGDESASSHT